MPSIHFNPIPATVAANLHATVAAVFATASSYVYLFKLALSFVKLFEEYILLITNFVKSKQNVRSVKKIMIQKCTSELIAMKTFLLNTVRIRSITIDANEVEAVKNSHQTYFEEELKCVEESKKFYSKTMQQLIKNAFSKEEVVLPPCSGENNNNNNIFETYHYKTLIHGLVATWQQEEEMQHVNEQVEKQHVQFVDADENSDDDGGEYMAENQNDEENDYNEDDEEMDKLENEERNNSSQQQAKVNILIPRKKQRVSHHHSL